MDMGAHDGQCAIDGNSGEPMNTDGQTSRHGETLVLADAFSEFIASSCRLELSYRELQEEVNGLGAELAIRNAALASSRADTDRMRVALQQIVDSMPCGVLVVDKGGHVSMINPESARILSLNCSDEAEPTATTLHELSIRSGINIDLLCECDAAQEICVRQASGDRWLEIRNRKLHQRHGAASGTEQTILILRDITTKIRAEEEREAGRKAMALAEITTMLAHEIRNPLASLELFAELIEQDREHAGDWISNLRAGIRSLSGTVNNVLSFHGTGSVNLVPISLGNVVNAAIRFAQPLADQAAVSLDWKGLQDGPKVMGSESALQQVLLNLITNGLRHTRSKGTVTVTLERKASSTIGPNAADTRELAILQVSDTGCGISKDQLDRIFTPGFSGNNDRTGLGLAVCERIMKQHGGTISASNGIRSGARFTLEFPVFQVEEA
jgi:signal transduction histidine kinase